MLNKRLLSLVSRARGYILKTVFFQWLGLLCSIGATVAVCLFIHACLVHDSAYFYPNIIKTCILVLLCVCLKTIFTKVQVQTATTLSQKAKAILRKKIFTHLAAMGQNYSQFVPTAEAVQVSVEGIEQLETYFNAYLPQLFYAILAPVTLFFCIAFVNLRTAAVLLLCVPVIPISIIAVQKLAKRLLSKYWTAYTNLGENFLENIQGLTTLKIYQADAEKHREMNENAEAFRKATMRVLIMQLNSISVMDLVAYGGAAAGMITMALQFRQGSLSFTEGLLIVLLSAEFFIPMRQLGSFFHIAMNGAAAADKIFKILDTPLPEKGTKPCGADVSIHAEKLGFSYDRKTPVLKEISFSTDRNGLFSFVGKSGCGKSTIAALLTGRRKGFLGSLAIGETAVSDISEKSLMETITLINHNSYLFKGTVRENLLMGNPRATDAALYEVLKAVNLYDLFRTQNGLDTPLLEQGANLSGGQRQRLALARALLHDTPIFILDEATSNIDAESEEIIMRLVQQLSAEKLILLISHRLANVMPSKRIFVMENGSIRTAGTHEELMQTENLYSTLFRQQKYFEAYSKGGVPQ